jgi:hypothetical protein
MLADRDKASSDRAGDYRGFAQMMSETFARGLEAMSQAGRPGGSTVVVPGREGIVLSDGAATSTRPERVVVCTECHADMPAGTRFCTSCGHQIA